MSIKAQREQMKKLNVKDRKLSRLLFYKRLTDDDSYLINYLYEEKQNLNFYYGICFPGFIAMSANFTFFRLYSLGFQFAMICSVTFLGHYYIRKRINERFFERVNPFYEKYEIK